MQLFNHTKLLCPKINANLFVVIRRDSSGFVAVHPRSLLDGLPHTAGTPVPREDLTPRRGNAFATRGSCCRARDLPSPLADGLPGQPALQSPRHLKKPQTTRNYSMQIREDNRRCRFLFLTIQFFNALLRLNQSRSAAAPTASNRPVPSRWEWAAGLQWTALCRASR